MIRLLLLLCDLFFVSVIWVTPDSLFPVFQGNPRSIFCGVKKFLLTY